MRKKNRRELWSFLSSLLLIILEVSCTYHATDNTSFQLTSSYRTTLDSLVKLDNKQFAINYLDSLYDTFSSISVSDKVNYYNYKRQLQSTRSNNGIQFIDSQLVYVDSIILLIEKNSFEKKMSRELLNAYKQKLTICTAWGLNEEASEVIAKTILLNLENKDTCATAENTKVMASIAFGQSKCDEAIELYKKALELESHCTTDGGKYYRTQLYLSDLALTFAKNKQNDSSLKYYFDAEKYIINNRHLSNDTLFPYEALLNVYANLGQVYRRYDKLLDSSEKYNLKAYDIAHKILKDTGTMAQVNIFLADTYLMQGKLNEAEQKLSEGLSQSSFFYLEDFQLSSRIGKDLALARQDYKKYSYFAEKYLFYLDSTNRIEASLQKKNPQAQYERLDKRRQVELLNKTNQIERYKSISAFSIAGLLLVLILTIVYYFRKNNKLLKNKAELFKSLFKKEEELKKTLLEKSIQEKLKKEEELHFQEVRLKIQNTAMLLQQRQKISQDLHDDLSNSIAALRYYIEDLLRKKNGNEDLESIREEVKTIYQNARSYAHSLSYNSNFADHNLLDMLEQMKKKLTNSSSLSFQVDIDENKFLSLLTTQQQDQLYYITNEAIANVLKHADASKITVVIHFDNNRCFFRITDNGKGFVVTNEQLSSLGLKGMQARVYNLGGTISIESGPNGTNVSGNFPDVHIASV